MKYYRNVHHFSVKIKYFDVDLKSDKFWRIFLENLKKIFFSEFLKKSIKISLKL